MIVCSSETLWKFLILYFISSSYKEKKTTDIQTEQKQSYVMRAYVLKTN